MSGSKKDPNGASGPRGLSTRPLLAAGYATVAALVLSAAVWARNTEIAGAVVAPGVVVVEGSVKRVQHPAGGIVAEIAVRDGDAVEAGQLLVRLDDTVTRANLKVVTRQLDEIAVRRARLEAEIAGAADIAFAQDIVARSGDAHLAEIVATERALFQSRREARAGARGQLAERVRQLEQEGQGLAAREVAKRRELDLARVELAGLEKLEAKKLVSTTKITTVRRLVAEVEGDVAQVVAEAAQARGRIAEIGLEMLKLEDEVRSEAGRELRDQQARRAELEERRITAEDHLKRIEVRAPNAGIVHQLAVHTVGGVVAAGEPLMLIVPRGDRLVVEARLASTDVDQVRPGQRAFVRFTAFNQRTTPEYEAEVALVSADVVMEAATRSAEAVAVPPIYRVRLTLTGAATPSANAGPALLPGMPAEVHIRTGDRSALSYLLKPLSDQFERAFRER